MAPRRCGRCSTKETDLAPLRSITICLDGTTSAGILCPKHLQEAKADVGVWMYFLDPLPGHAPPIKPAPLAMATLTATDVDMPPSRHRVPVQPRRRIVFIDEPEDAKPYSQMLLHVDTSKLAAAMKTWTMSDRKRAELLGNDIPVEEVYLLADDDSIPYTVGAEPGTRVKSDRGLTVILSHGSKRILHAYQKAGTSQ